MARKPTRPAGRSAQPPPESAPPKRGQSTYRQEFDGLLEAHMAGGKTFESFAQVIGRDRSTLYDWLVAHPTFSAARKKGEREYVLGIGHQLEQHMAEGLSFESFAAVVGRDKETLQAWRSEYPELAAAFKRGRVKCLLFWEQIGRNGAAGKLKGFRDVTFIFNMKNRFKEEGWGDVPQPTDQGADPVREAIQALDKEDAQARQAKGAGQAKKAKVSKSSGK